jgi:UDP-N-acetylglucosamine 2-epimerase (non-hydrolysing)
MLGIVAGTRPELIKLAPIVDLLERKGTPYRVLWTDQHFSPEMGKAFIEEFGIPKEKIISNSDEKAVRPFLLQTIASEKITEVMVQGDTDSALSGALCARTMKVKLYHLEAGLRTGKAMSPYPEELNRIIIDTLSSLHFAPTLLNKQNLLAEGIKEESIVVCGNTVLDSLHKLKVSEEKTRQFVITAHRRENWGKNMLNIAKMVISLADMNPTYTFKVFTHPNYQLKRAFIDMPNRPNVEILPPVGYAEFLKELARSKAIFSDSGGIMEEAIEFKTPVIVMRDCTERQESISWGNAFILNPSDDVRLTNIAESILMSLDTHIWRMKEWKNPYYDPLCLEKIYERISK